MKKLLAILVSALMVTVIPVETQAQEVIEPTKVGLVLFSSTCDEQILTRLMDYSIIVYLYMYKYYMPNVPQIFCFTMDTDSEYIAEAMDFINKYNEYVVVMFEDDLYTDGFAKEISDIFEYGFTDEGIQGSYGVAIVEIGVTIVQFHNSGDYNLHQTWDNGDLTSITLTHELAHLILADYEYGEDVYVDWVHGTDELIEAGQYESSLKLYSYISQRWYDIFEKYPIEEDF